MSLWTWCALAAADPHLDSLRNLLVPMRQKPAATDKLRGATPELTEAKHQLRDWVESRLAQFPEHGGEAVYAGALNEELHKAGLICGWDATDSILCPDWYQQGFVRMISLTRSSGFLELKTGAGIECGYDDSTYLYKWSANRWQRVWENEQNTYLEKQYKPQHILATLVSPDGQLVMTLGAQSWCSSNWREVYYRIFRLGSPNPVLDESQVAFEPESLQGRISNTDAFVEYWVASLDAGLHSRKEVRHYRIAQNAVERVDPIALIPHDFVEQWISRHTSYKYGEFSLPTLRCKGSPDRWQVGFTPQSGTPQYFIVQWTLPYHFSLVQRSEHASPDCTEPDPKADIAATLFPDRN
jgi:hypothetical protein